MSVAELEGGFALAYQWLLAGHLIFVTFWVAGLFMLPRYYVYHQEAPVGSAEEALWIEREAKIRTIIITPAMLLVWAFGVSLATVGQHWGEGWLHAKLVIVLALSAYYGWLVGYGRKLARGERPLTGRALRLMNEVPGLATVLIVVLAVVKPF